MRPNKQFDCLKMKNSIQETILTETAAMNTDELLSYFNASFAIDGPESGVTAAEMRDVPRITGLFTIRRQ
jgi:hypothetical protein